MSDRHVNVVNRIYEAFGTGDVPTILDCMAPEVDWEYGWAASPVPWLQPGRGSAHVASFFRSLAEHLEFQTFEVNHILPGDGIVVALVSLRAAVRATGRIIVETDEVHVWHFDDQGRVIRFRHASDTLQHAEAFGFEVHAPTAAR